MAEIVHRQTSTSTTTTTNTASSLARSCSAEAAAPTPTFAPGAFETAAAAAAVEMEAPTRSLSRSIAAALVRVVSAPLRTLAAATAPALDPPSLPPPPESNLDTTLLAPAPTPTPAAPAAAAAAVSTVTQTDSLPTTTTQAPDGEGLAAVAAAVASVLTQVPVPLSRAAPVVEDLIVILYRTTWLARLHASVDGHAWTASPGPYTAPCSLPGYEDCRMIAVPASKIRFVFHDGSATQWDNNRGKDYHIAGPGVYLLDSGVIIRVDTPTAKHPVSAVVFYTPHVHFHLAFSPYETNTPKNYFMMPIDSNLFTHSRLREQADAAVVGVIPGAPGVAHFENTIESIVDDAAGRKYAIECVGTYCKAQQCEQKCQLCFLPAFHLARVGQESSVEQWYKSTLCDHEACTPCLRGWIASEVQQGRLTVRCPFPNCAFVLYSEDVREHATDEDFEMYEHNNAQSFHERMEAVLADPEMKAYMEESDSTFCPKCGVLIERSEGCDTMVCTCGHSFCLRCKEIPDSCGCYYY